MVLKVVAVALLVACAQAIHYDGHAATSSIVFNDNHNAVQHIQSAYSAPSHGYSAPSYQSNAAPVAQYAAPVAHYAAPVAHYAAPVAHYAAPAVKVAAPVILKNAGPSNHGASSYSSLNFGNDDYQGHYAAPIAKAAAPVLLKAAPAHQASSYSFAAPAAHIAPVAKIAVAPVAYGHAAPSYNQGGYGGHHEEYAHPKYEFAYGVEDHHTGDIHSHKETRDGDVTYGEYSLHEADGTVRTVKYSVDKHSGFNAVVERSGHAQHAQPSKAIIKAVAPAPYYHH